MVRVLCTRTSEGDGSGNVVLIDGWLLINFIVRVLCTRKSEGGGSGMVVLIDGWLLIYD